MRTGCIYKHVNLFNGKVYIGQTIQNTKRRFRPGKMKSAYKSCIAFYNAIVKYGEQNFQTVILEDNIMESNLVSREEFYINKYNSCNPDFGYNIKNIVDNKIVFTDEIKAKISASRLGKPGLPQKKKWHVNEEYGETKYCSDCDQYKLLASFGKDNGTWDKLRSICRDCSSIRTKAYYYKNKRRLNDKRVAEVRIERQKKKQLDIINKAK